MKKVLLLSLLIPVGFTSTQSHASIFGTADRIVAGAVAGLVSAGVGKFAYDCIKGPRAHISSPQFEGAFGFMFGGVSAATATLAAVFLNPTDVSSATIAKYGTGFTFGALSIAALIKKIQVAAREKNSPMEENVDAILGTELTISAIAAGAVSAAAAYSLK